jgi:ribosomal protein L23
MKMINNNKKPLILGTFLILVSGLVLFVLNQEINLPGKKQLFKKEAELLLTSEKDVFSVGQLDKIKLFIQPKGGKGIVIASVKLIFNPEVIKVNNITGSDRFSNHLALDYDNQKGIINLKQGVAGGQEAIFEKTIFAEIEFALLQEISEPKIKFNKDETVVVSDRAKRLSIEMDDYTFKVKN